MLALLYGNHANFYLHDYENLDFEYLIYRKPKPKLCFGSTLNRCNLPTEQRYMNGFIRKTTYFNNPKIGPGYYDTKKIGGVDEILKKTSSKLGTMTRKTRFQEARVYQPPLQERENSKIKKRCKQQPSPPFNSSRRRELDLTGGSENPAPNIYKPSYDRKEIAFNYNLGGKKTLKWAVEVKCVPLNLDKCELCGIFCTEQGDYWQYQDKIFICRKDYGSLYNDGRKALGGIYLKKFKPVRDCGFMHVHEGPKSVLKIMSNKDYLKKMRNEAYLNVYFPQRKEI